MIRNLLFFIALSCTLPGLVANTLPATNPKTSHAHPKSFVKSVKSEPILSERLMSVEDEDEGENVEVNFMFNFDPDRYQLCSCDIFFHDIWDYPVWEQVDDYHPNIYLPNNKPAQICAIFYDNYADFEIAPYYVYVVIEDYYASEGDEVEIDPDMANKIVSFSSYLPDGEKCVLPSFSYDEDWNEIWDMDQANTFYMFIEQKIVFEGYGNPASWLSGGVNAVENGVSTERKFDFRITDVSDKVTMGQVRYIIPWDGGYYDVFSGEAGEFDIMYIETKGTADLSVSNRASDFKQFDPVGMFTHTPSFNKYACEYMTSRVAPFSVGSNGTASEFVLPLYTLRDNPEFWICKPNVESPAYQVGAMAGILESDRYSEDTWSREQTGIYAPPILLTEEGFEFVNSANFPYFWDMRPTSSQATKYKLLPGSEYNFFESDQNVVFGSSFPVNITYTQEMRTQAGLPVYVFQPTFIGTAGELRTADLNTLTVDVKYNGESQCTSYADLYAWYGKWTELAHSPGKIEATFIDSNYIFAGQQGKNTTVITYDENNTDKFAPSLEMLRLLSDDGAITQNFTTANLGKIQFSAGDFNCTGAYFRENPLAQVKLSVAPYNTEDYTELTAVKNDELSSAVSGFGAFFEADMSPISKLENNQLYDLCIELTDESGNSMVQTISPAFQLGEYSSISNIAVSGEVAVWAENGTIKVSASEGAVVNIFTIDGVNVFTEKSNSTISAPMQNNGVYIVSLTTESGASVTRKVVL